MRGSLHPLENGCRRSLITPAGPRPQTQDPRPKTQDPRPQTQDPRPKTPIPTCQVWRIYNVFGDDELDTRFISTCRREKRVTIAKDRLFDFFHVDDLCHLVLSHTKPDGYIRDTVYFRKHSLSDVARILKVPEVVVEDESDDHYAGMFDFDVVGKLIEHDLPYVLSKH